MWFMGYAARIAHMPSSCCAAHASSMRLWVHHMQANILQIESIIAMVGSAVYFIIFKQLLSDGTISNEKH